MSKAKLFILGLPGSGKGTISKILRDHYGNSTRYYDVGAILREQATEDNHIKQVHAKGGLVDSDRVLNIFDDALSQDSYIVDGSPRKPNEAQYILTHPKWLDDPGILIHLNLDANVAKQRLLQRGRFDDAENILETRMQRYFDTTVQSVEAFTNANRCITIDAANDPNTVATTIIKALWDLK